MGVDAYSASGIEIHGVRLPGQIVTVLWWLAVAKIMLCSVATLEPVAPAHSLPVVLERC